MLRRIGLTSAIVFAASLLSCTGPALAQQTTSTSNKPAAIVNGVEISVADLEAAVRLGGPIPPGTSETVRKQRTMETLGMLIDYVLMQYFLEKNTQPIPPAQVQKRLHDLEVGLKTQGKSLDEFCHDRSISPEQLKSSMTEEMRWSAYAEKRISDAKLQEYYEHYKDVFDKVTVRASHIVLRIPPGASVAEKTKANLKMQEIRNKLLNAKADFAEMARQYSQDPQNLKGGDLGWFPRKWVFEESFSQAAFSLQVGQISDIVRTELGLHLIKVTDRKPGEKSDFNKIKEAVRAFCTEDLRQEILEEQRRPPNRIELLYGK